MIKQTKYNIADSNIAYLGSEWDKKARLKAADQEPAWKGIGKEVGLTIWRIEKFEVVAVPKQTYGHFYEGDSYIVLHTYHAKEDSQKFLYDIHFWLGTFTTQDEAGTAAYKTVELDDKLGGVPVQYREVQGHESERFLSYFKGGIRILKGGVETGFHHVEAEKYRTRLLHLKGKKHVRVHEVPLSHTSLNSGDVFVLDAGKTVIQWNGSKAGILERTKAAELLQAIEGEREGRTSTRVVAESDNDEQFWSLLGGKGPVADAAAGGSDLEAEKKSQPVLVRLSNQSGTLKFSDEIKGNNFPLSKLDKKDVFVLYTGSEVYAWIGREADNVERSKALQYANKFVEEHKLDLNTPIAKILDGGENEIFNSYFHK